MTDVSKGTDQKALLDEIQEFKRILAVDPVDYPRANAPGLTIQRRQAQDALPQKEREYVTALQAKCVTIALLGPDPLVAAWAALAEDEGVELAVDLREVYRDIAFMVNRTIGATREWTASQHAQCVQLALSKCVDLGFKEAVYDSTPSFAGRVVNTMADVVEATRDTVRQRLGDDLARVYLRGRLTAQAVEKRLLPEQPIGVVVRGLGSDEEARQILSAWPSTCAVVTVTEEPTADQVVTVFRKTKTQSSGSNA